MDVIFFLALLGMFALLSCVVSGVGGEGERDMMQRGFYPPVPLHHS